VIQVENKKSDDGHVENEKFIYLLVIQETTMKFVDRYVYIVSQKFPFFHPLMRQIEREFLIVLIFFHSRTLFVFIFSSESPMSH
jgi:hypothetical protein